MRGTFVNDLLKLLCISKVMNYFKAWLRFPYHSNAEKCRLDTHSNTKV